jgi:hypothetical protein
MAAESIRLQCIYDIPCLVGWHVRSPRAVFKAHEPTQGHGRHGHPFFVFQECAATAGMAGGAALASTTFFEKTSAVSGEDGSFHPHLDEKRRKQ